MQFRGNSYPLCAKYPVRFIVGHCTSPRPQCTLHGTTENINKYILLNIDCHKQFLLARVHAVQRNRNPTPLSDGPLHHIVYNTPPWYQKQPMCSLNIPCTCVEQTASPCTAIDAPLTPSSAFYSSLLRPLYGIKHQIPQVLCMWPLLLTHARSPS